MVGALLGGSVRNRGKTMKVIICGGRWHELTNEDRAWLDDFHAENAISAVITGMSAGVDICADIWAQERGINRVLFPANWEGEGKKAGPLRNARMLWYLRNMSMPRHAPWQSLPSLAARARRICAISREELGSLCTI